MSQDLQERVIQVETPMDIPAPRIPRREGNLWIKAAMGLSVLAVALSCTALFFSLRGQPPEEEPQQPVPPAQSGEEQPPTPTLTYRDREIPVLENVAANQYDLQCFGVDERGWRSYQDTERTAIAGIDVSAYQGEIDWKQVADAGVEFAMIRCGYRGYSKGVIQEDSTFTKNIQGALDAGLEVGVYFFSQATNVWEAQEEADYVLQAIKDYNVTYPVAFDWEFIAGADDARTNDMQPAEITRCAGAFCDRVAQAGYDPVIYFNQDLGYLGYELDTLSDYTFWLAEYNETPSFYYHFDLWQYTHRGAVPGIEGDVDLNLDFRGAPETK